MSASGRKRWYATAAIAGLLGMVSLWGALASFELALAGSRLDQWRRAPAPILLDQAERQLNRAAPWSVLLPEGALRHGQLALFRAQTQRDAALFEDAVHWFRRSTHARPLWPDGHAWLAVAKARARQIDAEFHQALDRALALGPTAGRLLSILRDHSTVLVPAVEAAQRQAILDLASTTARFQPAWTAAVLTDFGWLQQWCDRRVAADDGVEKACRRHGWTPPSNDAPALGRAGTQESLSAQEPVMLPAAVPSSYPGVAL